METKKDCLEKLFKKMSLTFSTFLSEKLRDEGEVRSVSQKYARSGENVGEL